MTWEPTERDESRGTALSARSPLFEYVELEDVAALKAHAAARTYGPGGMLFQRGDAADGLHLIVEGAVRVILEGEDGRELLLGVLGPGDALGDLAILDGLGRSASAIAAGRVETLFVTAARFEEWIAEHPRALRAIAGGLAKRVRVNTEQIADMGMFGVAERVCRYLWRAFVLTSADGIPRADQQIAVHQGDLAETIAASRESVNREIRQLREDGIVATSGPAVVLLDAARLRALVRTL